MRMLKLCGGIIKGGKGKGKNPLQDIFMGEFVEDLTISDTLLNLVISTLQSLLERSL